MVGGCMTISYDILYRSSIPVTFSLDFESRESRNTKHGPKDTISEAKSYAVGFAAS